MSDGMDSFSIRQELTLFWSTLSVPLKVPVELVLASEDGELSEDDQADFGPDHRSASDAEAERGLSAPEEADAAPLRKSRSVESARTVRGRVRIARSLSSRMKLRTLRSGPGRGASHGPRERTQELDDPRAWRGAREEMGLMRRKGHGSRSRSSSVRRCRRLAAERTTAQTSRRLPGPARTPPRRASSRSGWDMRPGSGSVAPKLVVPPPQLGFFPKKKRECYCGNLAQGQVTEEVLRKALNSLFFALPMFMQTYPDVVDVVRSMAWPGQGTGMFAFVEFFDEVLAVTALQMTGFELCGRAVKVGRPQGFSVLGAGDAEPLDVSPLRQMGLLPLIPEEPSCAGKVPGITVVNKLRELWFGGLQVGSVNESVMFELLTPVCSQLSEFNPDHGPPVTKVTMSSNGTYCFVQFQNAEIASRIIAVFDGTELFGKRMKVNRPTCWQVSCPEGSTAILPPPPPPTRKALALADGEPSKAFLAGALAVQLLNTL